MSLLDLREAIGLIEREPSADSVGPRPEALVLKAERTLGLEFPPTYREFLLRLGCGGIGGEEFYGVIDGDFENSGVPDAIWLTLECRRSIDLPDSQIVVSERGDGAHYTIDTARRDENGESPVLCSWAAHPEYANPEEFAPDFGALFLLFVKEEIQYLREDDD